MHTSQLCAGPAKDLQSGADTLSYAMSPLFKRARRTRDTEQQVEPREGATAATPAGVDADELLRRPTSRRRGRLRKRLRHLRRTREMLLRDLGGFTYELHRSGSAATGAETLRAEKLARLEQLDEELRDLETRLDDVSGELLLREPGIGGFCPSCGELHGSDARFCSACGHRLDAAAAAPTAPAGPAGEDGPTEETAVARPQSEPDPTGSR